jgi:hypothetical protein
VYILLCLVYTVCLMLEEHSRTAVSKAGATPSLIPCLTLPSYCRLSHERKYNLPLYYPLVPLYYLLVPLYYPLVPLYYPSGTPLSQKTTTSCRNLAQGTTTPCLTLPSYCRLSHKRKYYLPLYYLLVPLSQQTTTSCQNLALKTTTPCLSLPL